MGVQISVPFWGGGAKHLFSQPPLLTISSGLGRLGRGMCSTICTPPAGEKVRFAPPLWRSLKLRAKFAQICVYFVSCIRGRLPEIVANLL